MKEILDKDGKVISKSHNLRGIRTYVSKNRIKLMSVDEVGDKEGKLCILFENGASFETNFCCYQTLLGFVAAWRNVRGAPCMINGKGPVPV